MNIDINNINPNRADGSKRQAGSQNVDSPATVDQGSSGAKDAPAKVNVSLSSSAQNLAKIEAELKSLPEVNQSRVDEVKARIDRGEYQPDSANLAQKMLTLSSN